MIACRRIAFGIPVGAALLAQLLCMAMVIGCSKNSAGTSTAQGVADVSAEGQAPSTSADTESAASTAATSQPADGAGSTGIKADVKSTSHSPDKSAPATTSKSSSTEPDAAPGKEPSDVASPSRSDLSDPKNGTQANASGDGKATLDSNPSSESNSRQLPQSKVPGDSAASDTPSATANSPAPGDSQTTVESNASNTVPSAAPGGIVNPFVQQIPIPEFPPELQWLNIEKPLTKFDLRGKFVLLDFWTYCCINCMHILPELKKLEQAYPNSLVVIGVHSAKFETEKGSKNIEEAILRYEIEHPVINDAEHKIWETYGVRSWPTVILIDPMGSAVWGRSGEFKAEEIREVLEAALPYYRSKNLLDEKPLKFELLASRQPATPLRFPGKVIADEKEGKLFIADSNHNRIVVSDLSGKLQAVIGSGMRGRADGNYAMATFDHPQGMALHDNLLYVADTDNHLLRKIDLKTQQVSTVAGIGEQARNPWPGLEGFARGSNLPDRWVGKPLETAISSPWDVLVHQQDLYIAMAGPHQIWKMPLDESEIGPYAGNGREDIVDGPLLPREPYAEGFASFAQPSGLGSDGQWLYVADSEGSSVRAVPFDATMKVRTVVGTADLPFNRLFRFGDRDGQRNAVLLQHCIGLTFADGQIYVADTYNNKIKQVDPTTGATKTIAGTGKPGNADSPAQFDEPAGVSAAKGVLYVADTNNHLIRTIDLASGKVGTLTISGLSPAERQ